MDKPKPFFFLVGKPASGKETQARYLAEKLGYPIFMSGAKFRELIASGTHLGERIKRDYETGALLPAWVADYLFQDFVLNLGAESGAIFEGSGRDLNQVDTIEEVTSWLERPYCVLNLQVSDETVIARSLARARDAVDASETAVKKRLADYEKLTAPAIARFHKLGKCFDVNGEAPIDEIHEEVMKHVHTCLS